MTTTMRAARLHEIAHPFQIDDVPVPIATGSDVIVRVVTCGLVPNLKNITHYVGTFLPLPELPGIFGLDPAGVVEAIGPDVTSVEVGQRVYVNPARSCGVCGPCTTGTVTSCESFTFAGYFGFGPGSRDVFARYPYGGFAEYTLAPENAIVPIPDNVSFEHAAHFGYLGTSYAGLLRGGRARHETAHQRRHRDARRWRHAARPLDGSAEDPRGRPRPGAVGAAEDARPRTHRDPLDGGRLDHRLGEKPHWRPRRHRSCWKVFMRSGAAAMSSPSAGCSNRSSSTRDGS